MRFLARYRLCFDERRPCVLSETFTRNDPVWADVQGLRRAIPDSARERPAVFDACFMDGGDELASVRKGEAVRPVRITLAPAWLFAAADADLKRPQLGLARRDALYDLEKRRQ